MPATRSCLWSPYVTSNRCRTGVEQAVLAAFGLSSHLQHGRQPGAAARPCWRTQLLDQSFGQFQADRDLTLMASKRRKLEDEVRELEQRLAEAGVDPDSWSRQRTSRGRARRGGAVRSKKRCQRFARRRHRDRTREAERRCRCAVGGLSPGGVKLRAVTASHARLTLTHRTSLAPQA